MLAVISWHHPGRIHQKSLHPLACQKLEVLHAVPRVLATSVRYFTAKPTVRRLAGSVESDHGHQLLAKEVPMRMQALKGLAVAAFIVMLGASSAKASTPLLRADSSVPAREHMQLRGRRHPLLAKQVLSLVELSREALRHFGVRALVFGPDANLPI
jgi:hypothetical protein